MKIHRHSVLEEETVPHDLGLYNRLSGIQLSDLALQNPLAQAHKGSLAEVACGLTLLWEREPFSQEPLYYWNPEAKSSNAEVDYVVSIEGKIVPLEVKASGHGAMHNMRVFLKEKDLKFGVGLVLKILELTKTS